MVPGIVTVSVVDGFKAIDIENTEREGLSSMVRCNLERQRALLKQLPSIVDAGKLIMTS
jgi:hypothetical protein